MFGKVLPALLVAVGAFSVEANALCTGTMLFKPPSTWSSVYVAMDNATKQVPATQKSGEYYVIDLATYAPDQGWGNSAVILSGGTAGCGSLVQTVGSTGFDVSGEVCNITAARGISCPGTGDTVYVTENPLNLGSTYVGSVPPNAKYIYVLVPDDKEWQSDYMMIKADGGEGVKMKLAPGMCGWFMMTYEQAPDNVIIYRKNKPDDQIGQQGLWGTDVEATPIPLKAILEGFGSDRLYFIPDDSQWPDGKEDQMGLFITDPGVSGECSFTLAAVIYDTDESLWAAKGLPHVFSRGEYQNEDNSGLAGQCLGVRTGIVQETLGSDNKPHLSTTGNGPLCFQDEATFSKLFNYTEGVNEVVCYDLPFERESDGRWGYNSDNAITNGYRGGFSPIENTTAADVVVMNGQSLGPTAGANTKRKAEGPVQVSYAGDFDKYCNSPGWSGGVGDCGQAITCGGKACFSDGDHPGVWNWDDNTGGIGNTARWKGDLRNQEFCFESHATFTYNADQEFSFRGDDDIWIFIAGRLAVDNGGTHLPAPGFVQLNQLKDAAGNPLVEGQDYALDIFFCDRRTTTSNVIIKTNMFIKQTSGLTASGAKQSDGTTKYEVCYEESGDGSCASVALGKAAASGSEGPVILCGGNISSKGSLKYSITTRAGEHKADLVSGQAGYQYGGINIADPFNPIINTDKITGLAPGSYRLVIDFYKTGSATPEEKARTYISFRIKGNLDVMTQTSVYTVNAGDEKSEFYKNGDKWEFVGEGLAGSRVPVYVSAFADGGVDLLGAVGQTYTLILDKGMTAYTSMMGDATVSWPRTIGPSGIDTVWVYQGLDGLSTNPEEKTVSLKTAAKIKFYAPRLDFAEPLEMDSTGRVTKWNYPLAGDPDSLDGDEYFHWIGSDVDLYVLIVNPVNNQICKTCMLSLELKDYSTGLSMPNEAIYLDSGAYVISIRSRKEYMDTTAYITIGSADDVNNLSPSSYVNMRFRKPPVPYPQLVDIFDARGAGLGALNIVEPFYSKSKDYLDGKADSIAIYYDRPFAPNPQGEYKDSLPFLICLDWDEKQFEEYNFAQMKSFGKDPGPADTLVFSRTKKDTAVACSYMIDSVTIYKAFEARFKANKNKSDSVLTFVAPADSAFSAAVKTAGRGKVLNFATYEDRKKVTKGHFDGSVVDRIAPVIVSARIENSSDQVNRLTVQLSEPVKMLDKTNVMAPFTFYMNSATDVSDANKYASSTARREPTGEGTDKLIILYDKTQGTKNPTPRMGDYIRFRADSWMWGDTVKTESDIAVRNAGDADMHWNSPTDYNSSKRLPSAWVSILGEYSVEVSAVKLARTGDIEPGTPVVQPYAIETFWNKDSILAHHPNTLGFIVQSDMAAFMSSDEKTEQCFKDKADAINDVYFQYEVQYYTNLGSYVAGDKKKIYCTDKTYFDKGNDCRDDPRNFYIAWNMLSDKGRLVGTGAYIAKLKSYVSLGKCGGKVGKAEETDMWGVQRGNGVVKK